MNELSPSPDMLAPIEDRGGAAQPLLEVVGLTKHFPVRGELFSARKTVRAVDDVSFSIAKGETVGIVGESGCGKSTTARLLMHLIPPDAGTLVFDGDAVGLDSHSNLRSRSHLVAIHFSPASTGAPPWSDFVDGCGRS